ncbi:sigma factor [Oenococcus sicerae]|uniref:sigma factor n=1 Tax=Oenococcus sicerae TaxID=2203724 RepID=UPI0039EC42F7
MEIETVVRDIREGNESGYSFLIRETEGFLHTIHHRHLQNVLEFDEWRSEAFCVLMNATQKYQMAHGCKFTTYYFSALHHKAMDLLRKSYSLKEKNRRKNISLDNLTVDGFDPVDHNWNQAQTKMDFEDAISETDFHLGKQEELAIKHLFGDLETVMEIEKKVKNHALDYRQKRLMKDIYDHFYGLNDKK